MRYYEDETWLKQEAKRNRRRWLREWVMPGFCFALGYIAYLLYALCSWYHTDMGQDSSTSSIVDDYMMRSLLATVIGVFLSGIDLLVFREFAFQEAIAKVGLGLNIGLVPLFYFFLNCIVGINTAYFQ